MPRTTRLWLSIRSSANYSLSGDIKETRSWEHPASVVLSVRVITTGDETRNTTKLFTAPWANLLLQIIKMATAESSSSRFRAFNKLLQFESKPPPLPPKDPIYLQQKPVNLPRTSTETSTASPEPGGSGSPSNSSTFTPVSPATEYAIRRANSPTWLQTTTTSALSTNLGAHLGQMNNMNADVNRSTTTLALTQGNNDAASGLATESTSAVASSSSSTTGTRPSTAGTTTKKPLGFLKFPKRSPRPVLPVDNGGDPPPPKEDDGISLPWNFQVCSFFQCFHLISLILISFICSTTSTSMKGK